MDPPGTGPPAMAKLPSAMKQVTGALSFSPISGIIRLRVPRGFSPEASLRAAMVNWNPTTLPPPTAKSDGGLSVLGVWVALAAPTPKARDMSSDKESVASSLFIVFSLPRASQRQDASIEATVTNNRMRFIEAPPSVEGGVISPALNQLTLPR